MTFSLCVCNISVYTIGNLLSCKCFCSTDLNFTFCCYFFPPPSPHCKRQRLKRIQSRYSDLLEDNTECSGRSRKNGGDRGTEERGEMGQKLNMMTKIESLCEWNIKIISMEDKNMGREPLLKWRLLRWARCRISSNEKKGDVLFKQQNSRHESERTGSKLSRKGRMSRVWRWKGKKRVDHRFAKAEEFCNGWKMGSAETMCISFYVYTEPNVYYYE